MAATAAMGPAFQQLMAALKGVGGAGMGLGKAAMAGAGPAISGVGKGIADFTSKGPGLAGLSALLAKNPAMTGGIALGAGGLAGGLGLNALMNGNEYSTGQLALDEEYSNMPIEMQLQKVLGDYKNFSDPKYKGQYNTNSAKYLEQLLMQLGAE
jgi:hypothetical protein